CMGIIMENKTKKEDLRVLKTYKALCDSFLQLLSVKKFEEITINELCETSMIRRATFYKHFEDKYDFFAFFVQEVGNSLTIDLEPFHNRDLSSNDYCLHLFTKFVHFIDNHRRIVNGVLDSSAFSTLFEIMSDELHHHMLLILQKQQENGAEFPVSLSMLAYFYTGTIIQVALYWVSSSLSVEELTQEYELLLQSFQLPIS
ncbi:MAG: TetR/AcrR family transcriptional regulator, partial [Lachnospiraceae bacterium]